MELYPTSFINKYIALSKQPTGNDFTPRQGFYLIIDYKTNTGSNGKKYTTALALYSDTATFNQVLLVSVYLHQLKNIASKGPKSLSFDMLVNNIIQIEKVNRLNVNYTSYQIIWDFIGGGEEVINHFRLVEKQQYRILEEMKFEEWLNEELEQLCFDELIKEEHSQKQSSEDWLDEEHEQLYIDQLTGHELAISNTNDTLYEQHIIQENQKFEDGISLDSHSNSFPDEEEGIKHDQNQQSSLDDDNVNNENLVD